MCIRDSIDGVRINANLDKAAVYAKVGCSDEAKTGWFGGTAGINSGTICNVKSTVSYTHLDVYKRQQYYILAAQCPV